MAAASTAGQAREGGKDDERPALELLSGMVVAGDLQLQIASGSSGLHGGVSMQLLTLCSYT